MKISLKSSGPMIWAAIWRTSSVGLIKAAMVMQHAPPRKGYGALARAAQAREPPHDALLAQQRFLVGAAEHLVEYGIDVGHSLVRS